MSYAIPFLRSVTGIRPGPTVALAGSTDQAKLVTIAKRAYEMRRLRDDMLGAALFSEPAWDMLLDLYISYHEGRQLSVSAVCIGARAPSATALRYLAILQEAGLVLRTRDQSDGRRSHIQLSASGRQRMAELLSGLADR